MIITKTALPRRAFLRGLGTSMALPFLDSMVPALGAAAKPAVRLMFVYHPTGMIMDKWTPAAEGANFELTPSMLPLAPFKDQLLVLSGLAQVQGRALGDGAGDHARESATWLTGVHPARAEGAGIRCGVSADQLAAQELGRQTQIASLEVGLENASLVGNCDSGYSCAYTNTLSWRGEKTPLPMEINPRALFERLFGDGDSTDPESRLERLQEQRSILDYVSGGIDRLQTRLGTRDRNKLSEYLEAVRDIERRIQRAEQQNATLTLPVVERPRAVPDTFEEHSRLMMDLIVLAYQTDMTRVITFMVGRGGSNRPYPKIGVSDGHHNLSHHRNDQSIMEKVAKIDVYLLEHFAVLLNKLKSTPDGEGSLLDHSVILYGSSLSDANIHQHHDLPIAVIGGGAGQLKGNRHLRFPQETPMNNLLLSMLDKAGVQVPAFGDSTGRLAGV